MTLAELRTLTLTWLDDPNAGYFLVPQLNVFLNNAQKEVQKRLLKAGENYYLQCVQTTMVVNQTDYVLPLDFFQLHRLELIISGTPPNESVEPIVPITTNQKDLIDMQVGQPVCYRFKKNRLVLQPAPNLPLSIRLFYSPVVTDMVLDTDVPDVPSQYHELVALLAAEDGFIKDGRENALVEKKIAAYQRDLDSAADERNKDVPRSIVQTGFSSEYGGYFY